VDIEEKNLHGGDSRLALPAHHLVAVSVTLLLLHGAHGAQAGVGGGDNIRQRGGPSHV
jgi:hypothetical protein